MQLVGGQEEPMFLHISAEDVFTSYILTLELKSFRHADDNSFKLPPSRHQVPNPDLR